MQKITYSFLISVLTCVVSSCDTDKENALTIVEGTVTNRYTSQPAGAVRVSVQRYIYGNYGTSRFDSITMVSTDPAGRYSLSFDAASKGEYLVKVETNQDYYALTTPPESDGFKVQRGLNKLNLEVTPYKTVTVNANSSKNGKTNIEFFLIAWDQKGSDYRGSIFSDSARTSQRIVFTKTVKVLPNRDYRFVKITSNRLRLNSGNVEYRDETWDNRYRTVFYNDTTVVNFN
ncbi:hypothetical protein [Hymenobacter sp.]|uniref:hypothetical protein n=1 Tax=Hymenobacter sp. TaxID=1898978 RepID=UPI00286AC2E2|nr:hypothetical protein [Hymenobacter sp.]